MTPLDPENRRTAPARTVLNSATALTITSQEAKIKSEVDAHLRTWRATGNPYSLRLANVKNAALAKEAL